MRRQLCVHSWLYRLCRRCWRTAALAIAASCAAARYAGLRCSGAPSHSSCCAWLLDANNFNAVCVYCCCSNTAGLLCGRAYNSDRSCRSRRSSTQASRLVQRLLQAAAHAKYALLVEDRPRYNCQSTTRTLVPLRGCEPPSNARHRTSANRRRLYAGRCVYMRTLQGACKQELLAAGLPSPSPYSLPCKLCTWDQSKTVESDTVIGATSKT